MPEQFPGIETATVEKRQERTGHPGDETSRTLPRGARRLRWLRGGCDTGEGSKRFMILRDP